ncbi:hypothetical protein V1527DRAFT_88298 [Lipomyces starkeyi]
MPLGHNTTKERNSYSTGTWSCYWRRAQIKIEFAKGSKNVRNEELEFPTFGRSSIPTHVYSLPPHDHALRHALVVGSSIREVLEHASNAADGRVVWTFPDRP